MKRIIKLGLFPLLTLAVAWVQFGNAVALLVICAAVSITAFVWFVDELANA